MTRSFTPFAHALTLLFVTAILAGCAGQISRPAPDTGASLADQAEQAALQNDYARAADLYMRAARETTAPETRQQLQLQAALAAAQDGETSQAEQLLDGIQPSSLTESDRGLYELARTEVRIASMPPTQALQALPPPPSGAPPQIAQRVWQKRANLHFASNDLIAGIGALVQRGIWLIDERAIEANANTIYDKALKAIGYGQGPHSRAARSADGTTRGWLALAAIGQRRWANRQQRDRALADWESRYPSHPATRHALEQRFDYDSTTAPGTVRGPARPAPRPQSDTVALALPMTGDFANAAQAIHDGFMFAYTTDETNAVRQRPLMYDTQNMSASEIASQAQRDDVGILVGPLQKTKVTEMSRRADYRPTIGLNYTDTQVDRAGFYQFALAPEDEARAVARHADDQGHTRAIALVPEGDWGSRVFEAFRDAFNKRGGQLVDYATYNPEEHDHRKPIQALLRSYHQGGQGIDFIFVAAQPVQARLIRSQLRFYRATNLPMLSTSHLYTGTADPGNDIDLNGVRFADMPWVIGNGDFIERRRRAAEQRYGSVAERYARLFAMGMDAWRLTAQIAQTGLRAGDTFEGMSGVLAVRPDGRIHRYLAWARFRDGKPQLVDMPSRRDAERDSHPITTPWAQP